MNNDILNFGENMTEQTQVKPTENIAYAGFWQRAGAVIIDAMALQCFCLLVAVGVVFVTPEGNVDKVSKALNSVLFFLTFVAYEPLMECSRYQATIGKIAAGIKVASMDGKRIGWVRAFGRRFAMLFSMLPMFIGFLFPVFTNKKQALHDLIAETVVLKVRVSYFWRVMAVTLVLYVAVLASAGFYVAKNLGAWVTSGITAGAVVVKQETDRAQQSAIVQEEVNKNAPIKPYNISEQRYEELLAKGSVNFTPEPQKPTVFPVKPMALELSTFFDGISVQWIEVHVSPDINLGRGGYAIVSIDNVLNGNGEDVYDKANSFETEFHQKIFKSIIAKDVNPISEIRSVHVKKDTKEADIQSVSGVIRLFLPINTQIISITGADVGKTKDISPDLQIMVQRFGNGEVSFDAIGKGKDLLLNNFYAYTATGSLLQNGSWGIQDDDAKKHLSWKVKGTPASAELVVAEKILEKEYSFTLKK